MGGDFDQCYINNGCDIEVCVHDVNKSALIKKEARRRHGKKDDKPPWAGTDSGFLSSLNSRAEM